MTARGRIALLLFGSGLCALVYQVAWLSELRLVFGASTPASAAVLAVFMGGLGYGSLRLSKRAEQADQPLVFYGNLELAIAGAAAISPLLLWVVRLGYAALGGTMTLGTVGGTALRLLASAVVLLPPTFLMGGTLPAAARAAEREGDIHRHDTALLYGANTVGAVVGATLTTFLLMEVFGTRLSLWLGCGLNALVAVLARSMGRRLPARAKAVDGAGAGLSGEIPHFVLVAAGAVGFVFLLLELCWYRMLAPLLGGSTYTFGLILAVALFGVGAGGLIYARRRAVRPSLQSFAFTCALEGIFVALPLAFGDRLALFAVMLRPFGMVGLAGHALGWTIVTAIVVLPAALVAGYQFPLLVALLGRGREHIARHVGLAYASNTLGSITGSLAGGFLLLPWLSAPRAWRGAALLLGLLGGCALLLHARAASSKRGIARPAVLVVLALAAPLLARGPTAVWRHSPIGAGRADHVSRYKTRNELRRWLREQRYAITWEAEGRESSIALHRLHDTAFIVNGKTDGSAIGDATTQVMGGMLGSMLHGNVKRALVIGLGSGSTAGWLGQLPDIERVDVVEIEPAMLEVARKLAPVNEAVLDNPRVHVHIGDAREVLLTQPDTYDLIFSEPSNPYRAGVASLFTRELYQAVQTRLRPGGVFVQWVQGYDIDGDSVGVVYTTLSSVFGAVSSWRADVSDLLLIAGNEERTIDVPELAARIRTEPYRRALMGVWRVSDVEGVLAHFVAGPELARRVAASLGPLRINTDDRNLLEFSMARSLGRPSRYSTPKLHRLAAARGYGRPALRGTVSWDRVDEARATITMSRDGKPAEIEPGDLSTVEQSRYLALRAWAAERPQAALQAWAATESPPTTMLEHMVLADCLAATGRGAQAAPLIDALREEMPTEALAIEARAAFFTGNDQQALAKLTAALEAYRTNPWPVPELMLRALAVAPRLAKRAPSTVSPLVELLSVPFVTDSLRVYRERYAVDIAALHDDPTPCVRALSAFEPHAPWERDFLHTRWECYRRAGHELEARAREELDEWLADSGMDTRGGFTGDHDLE